MLVHVTANACTSELANKVGPRYDKRNLARYTYPLTGLVQRSLSGSGPLCCAMPPPINELRHDVYVVSPRSPQQFSTSFIKGVEDILTKPLLPPHREGSRGVGTSNNATGQYLQATRQRMRFELTHVSAKKIKIPQTIGE